MLLVHKVLFDPLMLKAIVNVNKYMPIIYTVMSSEMLFSAPLIENIYGSEGRAQI